MAFLFSLAGLAAICLAIAVGGAHLAARDASFDLEAIELDDAGLETDAIPEPDIVMPGRPASEIVAPVAATPEPLQRIEPRAPLSDLALAVPPKPGAPAPTLLYHPVASASGRIEAQGHVVVIEGIEMVEPGRRCPSASGGDWPCGMVARTAFRNFLRGRAVECTVSDVPAREPVVSACRLGDQDVALWLVESGLAEARPDGAYAAAGEAARRAGRGVFADGPPSGN